MRYTLKDYQNDAVADVLERLAWARDDWHQRMSPVALSLTATTGAGKTVMAAAVIEALFDGNPDYEFDSDAGAVVLWFTDDPSLNEQTRFRLLDAADRIAHSRLVVIENTFNQEKLERGKVYFLNAQKLGEEVASRQGSTRALSSKSPVSSADAGCACIHVVGHAGEHYRRRAPHPVPHPRRGPQGNEAAEQGRPG